MRDVIVIGTGRHLPKKVVTSDELVKQWEKEFPDTTLDWILARTGVEQRHVAASDEHTSGMAEQASRNCLNKAGVNARDVDLIVVSTVSSDTIYPATANWLQGKLGNTRARSFDINAGCSGFVYGLDVVTALLRSGRSKLALLVGAEKMSALYDPRDRTSYPLAGDGAAAVLLRGVESDANPKGYGIWDFYTQSDGRMAPLLTQPLGGTSQPLTRENIDDPKRYLQMDGRKVYTHAVRRMTESILKVLELAQVSPSSVNWFVGHQANERILRAVAGKLGEPAEKVYSNIARYANTTSATIPLCLDELAGSGQLLPGHKVVLFTFGTGFTWGACYLIWGN